VQEEEDEIVKKGQHEYHKKCRDFEVEQTIFLFNKYFELNLSSSTREKIKAIF
jgi:hypothetical protein